ncbi:MAG TPA: DUF4923 family protein [Cytophagaceae bacterium]
MKTVQRIFIFLTLITFFAQCKNEKENAMTMIAGEGSKRWKATKEVNAAGEKEKLSKEEKNEIMQFYTNGTFTINAAAESSQGTWTYDDNAKNLSLKFGSANFTENFTVLELEKDEMKLKAGDGSTMIMESQKD